MKKILLFVSVLIFSTNLFSQIYYVKTTSNGGNDVNDGLTWSTAKANPQAAIAAAENAGGGEVWIAEGIYTPTLTKFGNSHLDSIRYYTFSMKNNVFVYGGFSGIEGETKDTRQKSDLDGNGIIEPWEFTKETIFNGNVQNDADSTNNCYHVVYFGKNITSTASINGISVVNGFSDRVEYGGPLSTGGLVYCSGIYSLQNGIIENCYIRRCSGYHSSITIAGGGVFLFSNSSIVGSKVENCFGASQGGGIHNSESSIENCFVRNCSTKQYAGGVLSYKSQIKKLSIYNCNTAQYGGGGYFNNCSVDSCIITDCFAKTAGGGMYNMNNTIISNSNIKRCYLISLANPVYGENGGGAYVSSSTITNTTFDSCYVYSTVQPSSINVVFGGSVFCSLSLLDSCTITNSSCISTHGQSDGGGVSSINSTIKNCKIQNSYAKSLVGYSQGGGISISGGISLNNSISNCYSLSPTLARGGGIGAWEVKVFNCSINNCSVISPAECGGGGLYSRQSNVINCTITRCYAKSPVKPYGGGVFSWQDVLFANSIIWGNETSSNTNNQYLAVESVLKNCAIQFSTNLNLTDGNIAISPVNSGNDIDIKYPFFKSMPDSIGYLISQDGLQNIKDVDSRLLSKSSCINNGSNSFLPSDLTSDLEGNSRILHNTVDMGAYEFLSDYIIYTNSNEGGSISPEKVFVNDGDDVTITITPENGYRISSASYNSLDILSQLITDGFTFKYLINDISGDGIIDINFSLVEYNISTSIGLNGSIEPVSAVMTIQDSKQFIITCDYGYTIETAHYNGIDIKNDLVRSGSNYIYTLSNVSQNGTIVVAFGKLDNAEKEPQSIISIYPNPFNNKLYIQSAYSDQGINVKIVDMQGKTVFSKINFTSNFLTLEFLPKGVYQIIVEQNQKKFIRKIIKL